MYNILLIESNLDILDLLSICLKREIRAEVAIESDSQTAITRLKTEKNFKLIIVRQNCRDNENSAKDILNYCYDNSIKIPIIVMGDPEVVGMRFVPLPEHFKIEKFLRTVIATLKISKEEMAEFSLPDYLPIPIHHFFLMNSAICDVYIRLDKKSGPQYIKRLYAEDEFDKAMAEKYKSQGVEFLYIEKEHRHDFNNNLLEQAIQKLESDGLPERLLIEIRSDTYDLNQSLIMTMGLNEQTVTLAKKSIETMAKSVSAQSNKLGPLIKELLKNKATYSFKRAYLSSIFSYGVIPKMNWGGVDRLAVNFEIMTFVCFFHDILLKEEHLLRITSKIDFYKAKLEPEDKKKVLNHANLASTLIQSFPHAPPGADVIIRQHHGTTNGMGFAENYSSSISSMAIVFIVIEDFVCSILGNNELDSSFEKIFINLNRKYPLPSYRRAIEALRESLVHGF